MRVGMVQINPGEWVNDQGGQCALSGLPSKSPVSLNLYFAILFSFILCFWLDGS